MNKPTLLLVLASMLTCGVQAKSLTPEEALDRLFRNIPNRAPGNNAALPNLVVTETGVNGNATLYVFNKPSGNGYLIVSADDNAAPLLGYADNGTFNPENLSPQMQWWLGEYSRQIEYASTASYMRNAPDGRKSIEPLLKTKWNQNAPYNMYAPKFGNQNCPTGCVATAMSQVMKYWNYPEKGTGSGTITLPGTSQKETMYFSEVTFDWENMLNSYNSQYSTQEAQAVATLMKATGYSCDMTYNPYGSGAITMNAAKAFVENFKYNKNLQLLDRDYFTATEWGNWVYGELAAGRPVLYTGNSTSVGHAFVCDGYSSDGYFHFNWGWGGMSDGYFLLEALNPDAVGTGGGTGGGFNFSQEIMVGVQPDETGLLNYTLTQTDNLNGQYSKGTVNLSLTNKGVWLNSGLWEVNVVLGVHLASADGTFSDYIAVDNVQLGAPKINKTAQGTTISYSYIRGDLSFELPSQLADGKYTVTVCTRPESGDNAWTPVNVSQTGYNYVTFTKTGNNVVFDNLPDATVTINADGTGLGNKLYYGCATKVTVSVTNNSEREITKGFYPLLCVEEDPHMLGEGIMITLQPGETVTREFQTVFEPLQGISKPASKQIYNMKFYDPSTDEIYDWSKRVTMYVGNVSTTLELTDLAMPGLDFETFTDDGGEEQKMYKVYDKATVPFSCTVTNPSGYYAYPLSIYVFPIDGGNAVEDAPLTPTPMLESGQSADLTCTMDFEDAVTENYYKATVVMQTPTSLEWVDENKFVYFRIMDAGVGDVEAEGAGISVVCDRARRVVTVGSASELVRVDVFDAAGRVVAGGNAGGDRAEVSLARCGAGIYVVRAVDRAGHSATVKVAL